MLTGAVEGWDEPVEEADGKTGQSRSLLASGIVAPAGSVAFSVAGYTVKACY